MNEAVYHITPRAAWAEAKGAYQPESFKQDGFIHCSTLHQVLRVANAWYRGQRDLVLLKIDPSRLVPGMRWEPGTDKPDELFPHVYGAINLDAVQNVYDLEADPAGEFHLPADLG